MSSNPQIGLFPGPAWYHADWIRRFPIAVDAVTGGDSGSVKVNVVIPSNWDWFWDGVQDTTNGYDIIVCGQDGVTLLDFQYSGLDFATRTLTLQINALALDGTGKMNMIWLYWFQTSAVSDLTTTFTPAAAITGYITLVGPAGYLVTASMTPPTSTEPVRALQKKTTETISVWVDISGLLSLSGQTYNGKYNREGVEHVTASTVSPGGPTVTNTLTRYTYFGDRLYAIGNVSAGTTATEDALSFVVVTTEGRILDYRVGITIDDIDI